MADLICAKSSETAFTWFRQVSLAMIALIVSWIGAVPLCKSWSSLTMMWPSYCAEAALMQSLNKVRWYSGIMYVSHVCWSSSRRELTMLVVTWLVNVYGFFWADL